MPEIPVFEATYEDQQSCLIGVREVLALMLVGGRPKFIDGEWMSRPRRTDTEERREAISHMIAMIDRTHPPDNSALR